MVDAIAEEPRQSESFCPKRGTAPLLCKREVQYPYHTEKRYITPIIPKRSIVPLSQKKEVQYLYHSEKKYSNPIIPKRGTAVSLSCQNDVQYPYHTTKSYSTPIIPKRGTAVPLSCQNEVQYPYHTKKRCSSTLIMPKRGTVPLSYHKEVQQYPYHTKKRYSSPIMARCWCTEEKNASEGSMTRSHCGYSSISMMRHVRLLHARFDRFDCYFRLIAPGGGGDLESKRPRPSKQCNTAQGFCLAAWLNTSNKKHEHRRKEVIRSLMRLVGMYSEISILIIISQWGKLLNQNYMSALRRVCKKLM